MNESFNSTHNEGVSGHMKEDCFIPLSLKLIEHDNLAMNDVIIRSEGRLIKEGVK